MSSARIVGIVIAIVGVVLLLFGINATDSLTERASETLTGRYSDQTMWYMIGGVAALLGGGLLAVFGKKS